MIDQKLDRKINSCFHCLFYKFSVVFLFLVFYFLFSTISVNAASMYFSPAAGSYEVGKTFSVNVYVSSADQAMNAASGVISFPKDKLEISSLSRSGSIFSLWAQEPTFSNSTGVVNFEGIVLNPGFRGSAGKIMTISFKVKSAGQAGLNFTSGSCLANDGAGTNILNGMGSAKFQLSGQTASLATPTGQGTEQKLTTIVTKNTTNTVPAATNGVPAAPQVLSSTHPDSNNWYSNNNPQFSWVLPADVTGVSVYFSQSPTSNPGPASNGLVASKSYEKVDDGIWYFHIKMKNSIGWGPITHFKIQIDTQPPAPFVIKFIDTNETINPRPTVLFNTTDSLSGIDYYRVKIGEGDFINLTSEKVAGNSYTLPPQLPGTRNILVEAFDKAGNHVATTEEFTIKSLETPIITEYPKDLASGEVLVIKGTTIYPNQSVIIWLQGEKGDAKSQTIKTDEKGNFTFIPAERLADGIYNFWAEVENELQARSLPTDKLTLVVRRPALVQIGSSAITLLSVAVPLVALIILLLFILWYSWHKFSLLKQRLQKEVSETERLLHRTFDFLREDVQKQVKMIERTRIKRQLTKEEEKICKNLQRDLDGAEKFVRE